MDLLSFSRALARSLDSIAKKSRNLIRCSDGEEEEKEDEEDFDRAKIVPTKTLLWPCSHELRSRAAVARMDACSLCFALGRFRIASSLIRFGAAQRALCAARSLARQLGGR